MDPPTEARAHELYLLVLDDLERVKLTEGVAREAVLLRVSNRVGELAEIAEGADVAPVHEGSWRRQASVWVVKISWELLKILSDTDFYTLCPAKGDSHVGRIDAHTWASHEAHPRVFRSIAA